MLPEIHGIATLHGKPLVGLEVRRSLTNNNQFPNCSQLPVVGVSGISGAFRIPALYRPRLLVNLKDEAVVTCYMHDNTVVTSLVGFPALNQFSSIEVRCELPGLHTSQPEDTPCYFVDANYSLQRTAYRGR